MAEVDSSGNDWTDTFITAQDGLKLHVRDYGSRLAPNTPVVCLPGLARTAADFDDLARALAADPDTPRRVLALDYRGRGLSDYDRDPRNYSLNFSSEECPISSITTRLTPKEWKRRGGARAFWHAVKKLQGEADVRQQLHDDLN